MIREQNENEKESVYTQKPEMQCFAVEKTGRNEPLAAVGTVFTGHAIANMCPEKPYLKRIKLNP